MTRYNKLFVIFKSSRQTADPDVSWQICPFRGYTTSEHSVEQIIAMLAHGTNPLQPKKAPNNKCK